MTGRGPGVLITGVTLRMDETGKVSVSIDTRIGTVEVITAGVCV